MRIWLLTFIAGLLLIAPTQADDKIAFTSTRTGTGNGTGNADVFVMSPDGTGQTNLTNSADDYEEFPSWSPDGSKIIFNRKNNLWTISANGSNPTQVPTIGSFPNMAAFQTNSSRISYSRFGGYDYDIYTANSNGTGETRIVNQPLGDYYARWSPNGTRFTYHTFEYVGSTTVPNIFFANPDGTGAARITSVGGNSNASWSPDGGQIVFESNRDGNNEIYIVNAYGTIQTRLTNNSYSDTYPVFSPDGTKIAFVSNRDGNNEIYVMRADGTNQTRLTTNTANDNCPSWGQTLLANAPSASINDVTVNEGNSGITYATFTISLNAASTVPVSIGYRTYDGTAYSSDYTPPPPSTVLLAAGELSRTITVPIKGDVFDEPNENFSVRIAPVGARLGKQQGIATIIDDDATPTISINDITKVEGNGVSTATATVTLSAISGQTVTVNYATANFTALAGSDYTAKTGTVTFAPGQNAATIAIDVLGDFTPESNETFNINLSNPVNATIAKPTGIVTLTNDDILPTISINDVTSAEGNAATFTISLSNVASLPVQVKYRTYDATAIAGSDYTTISGTAIVPAGQNSVNVTVSTLADSVVEASEYFNVVLTDPVNGIFAKSMGVGTITNTNAPTIYVSDVSMREGNSGTGQRFLFFTVGIADPLPFLLTVNYATANGSAIAGSDYTATTGTLNFAPGQLTLPFSVPVIADTAVEANETFLINLTANANGLPVSATGTGTIVNDDTAPGGGTSAAKKAVSTDNS